MFSKNHIHVLLKDNKITLHMMAYMSFFSLRYENSDACFPNFGAARTPYLMYDVYTNDSKHRLCFPTLRCLHVDNLSNIGNPYFGGSIYSRALQMNKGNSTKINVFVF